VEIPSQRLHLTEGDYKMRKRLGFALGFVLVTLALSTAPAQGGTCTLTYCGPRLMACQRACGHVIACTNECRDEYNSCSCLVCGVC